jgi:hypothetical protein
MFYLFKAYGCLVKHQFEIAFDCYKKAGKLDELATFNKYICEGVLKLKVKEYMQALRSFSMASILFPNNKNGYLYQAIAHIACYLNTKYLLV